MEANQCPGNLVQVPCKCKKSTPDIKTLSHPCPQLKIVWICSGITGVVLDSMEISFRLHARSLGSPSSNSFFGQFLLNKLFFSLIVRFKNISKRLCVLTNLYNEVLQGACFKAHNAFWEKLLLNGDREYFLRLSFG